MTYIKLGSWSKSGICKMMTNEKVSAENDSTQGGETSSEMEFVVQKRIIKEVMVRIEMGNTLTMFI